MAMFARKCELSAYIGVYRSRSLNYPIYHRRSSHYFCVRENHCKCTTIKEYLQILHKKGPTRTMAISKNSSTFAAEKKEKTNNIIYNDERINIFSEARYWYQRTQNQNRSQDGHPHHQTGLGTQNRSGCHFRPYR